MSDNRRTHEPTWANREVRRRCLREARRYLPDAEAEDAVQEALLRAYRRRDAWVPPSGPLPWLLTITRNEAFRLLDRNRRSRTVPVADPPDQPGEDSELERVLLRMAVADGTLGLPDEDRALLQMRYGDEDLDNAEIGRRLGIPEGTVKSRLNRVRGQLRPLLPEPD